MSRNFGSKSVLQFIAAAVTVMASATSDRASGATNQFLISDGSLHVTSVVMGGARGFSDTEALALVRRGVERGLQRVQTLQSAAPPMSGEARLVWTIRDSGHPARPWVDVYVPAHDGIGARQASDSIAASAAPTDVFVRAVADLTERALATANSPGQAVDNRHD